MSPFVLFLVAATLGAASPTAREADAAFQKHAWAKAAEAYKTLTEETPEDGVAWLRLGLSLMQLKQGADAIPALERAEKLGVNANLVQYELAKAAALAGDKNRAIGILQALDDEDYAPVGPPVAQEKAFAALVDDPRFQKAAADFELNRAPCKGGELAASYRQLDFWLGEWKVVDKAGDAVGTSHVERILGGCALQETWHGVAGGERKSLSTWNPGLRRWEHYATDGQGVPIFFTGGFIDTELQLRADAASRRGVPLKWRLTLSKLPGGRVRELGETSTDSGRSWTVQYDFTYEKGAAH